MLKHPAMLSLSVIPFLFGLMGFVVAVTMLMRSGSAWMDQRLTGMMMVWFSGWSDEWYWMAFYWIVKALMFASVLTLGAVMAMATTMALASPVNEYISVRVERDLLGVTTGEVSWRDMPRVLFGELAKASVVILVPTLMLWVPGVNIFAGVVAAFLLGWDFYDYPLARRGWGFGQRMAFVAGEFWTVLGFGLWLAIPVVHLFLLPLAVAGGTILNVEALARKGLVKLKDVTLGAPATGSVS
jgi:uncharacterized protein involved in cysteine biosynthesis